MSKKEAPFKADKHVLVHGIHKGAATRPYIQSVSECNKKPQKLVCILLVSQSELFR